MTVSVTVQYKHPIYLRRYSNTYQHTHINTRILTHAYKHTHPYSYPLLVRLVAGPSKLPVSPSITPPTAPSHIAYTAFDVTLQLVLLCLLGKLGMEIHSVEVPRPRLPVASLLSLLLVRFPPRIAAHAPFPPPRPRRAV